MLGFILTRMKFTIHEDLCRPMSMAISLLRLPKMRNALDKSCTENQNEHFTLNK
jgi:hypothetical protein